MSSDHNNSDTRVLVSPSKIFFNGSKSIHLNLLTDRISSLPKSTREALTSLQQSGTRSSFARKLGIQAVPTAIRTRLFEEENHGSNAVRRFLAESLADAAQRNGLQELAELETLGFVMSEEDLLNVLIPDTPTGDRAELTCFGIVTANRPEMLKRSLPAFAHAIRLRRPTCNFLIIDDSANETSASENIVFAEELNHADSPVKVIDRRARVQFVKDLAKSSGISPHLLEFAFLGEPTFISTGAARNTAHVLATGRVAMFSDDDTYPAYVMGTDESRRILTPGSPSYKTTFFPDREAWNSFVSHKDEVDIIEIHENLIGRLKQSLSHEREFAIQRLDDKLYKSLRSGFGRVGISTMGTSGDTGMNSHVGYLLFPGEIDPVRDTDLSHQYENIRSSRQILRIPTETQVSASPSFQTMSYCIDLAALQLPFFPAGRNTDGAFSHLARRMHPEILIAHSPLAVWHQPPDRRESNQDLKWATETLWIADWLIALSDLVSCPAGLGSNDALSGIGMQLKTILSTTLESFGTIIYDSLAQRRATTLLQIEYTLDTYSLPHNWAEELRRSHKQMSEQSMEISSIVPLELRSMEPKAATLWMRETLLKYSDLIMAWPHVIEHSRNSRLTLA
jgi:hypothetical protein